MNKHQHWRTTWLAAFAAIIVLGLGGCASTVYKDYATTYVGASRDLVTALGNAQAATAKALDTAKTPLIIKDASCPIQDDVLFVRDSGGAPARYLPFLNKYADIRDSGDCRKLTVCSESPRPDYCARACLTSAESTCLSQLSLRVSAMAKKAAENAVDDPLKTDAKELQRILGSVQVGSTGLNSARLADDAVRTFTAYLDLLGAHIDKNKSDLEERAKLLATRIKARADDYSNLTSVALSSGAQAEIAAQEKYLGAFGKLAADLQVLSRDAKDADKIRQIVIDNEPKVAELIHSLEEYLTAEARARKVIANQSAKAIRKQIADKYAATANEYDRLVIFAEREKYPLATDASTLAALNAVFEAIDASHTNLVRLIKNPNAEDTQKIRDAQLQSFKTIAGDVISVINLFR